MADIAYINSSNTNGARLLAAIRQINSGLGDLWELDGARLNSISISQAVMAQNFGVSSEAGAQIVADRMGALVAWVIGAASWPTTSVEARQMLLDLLNATQVAP